MPDISVNSSRIFLTLLLFLMIVIAVSQCLVTHTPFEFHGWWNLHPVKFMTTMTMLLFNWKETNCWWGCCYIVLPVFFNKENFGCYFVTVLWLFHWILQLLPSTLIMVINNNYSSISNQYLDISTHCFIMSFVCLYYVWCGMEYWI